MFLIKYLSIIILGIHISLNCSNNTEPISITNNAAQNSCDYLQNNCSYGCNTCQNCCVNSYHDCATYAFNSIFPQDPCSKHYLFVQHKYHLQKQLLGEDYCNKKIIFPENGPHNWLSQLATCKCLTSCCNPTLQQENNIVSFNSKNNSCCQNFAMIALNCINGIYGATCSPLCYAGTCQCCYKHNEK